MFKLVLLLLLLPRCLLFKVLFLTWLLKRILLFLLGVKLEIFLWMKCEGFVIDMFFVDTWPCNRLQRLTLKLRKDLVGGFKHLVGYPYLGKLMEMNQFDKHIFQVGWNHQPGILFRPLPCLFIGNFLDKAAVWNGEKIAVLKLTPSWSVPRTPICSMHLTLWRTEESMKRNRISEATVDGQIMHQLIVHPTISCLISSNRWISDFSHQQIALWLLKRKHGTWKSDPRGKEIPFGKHHDFMVPFVQLWRVIIFLQLFPAWHRILCTTFVVPSSGNTAPAYSLMNLGDMGQEQATITSTRDATCQQLR